MRFLAFAITAVTISMCLTACGSPSAASLDAKGEKLAAQGKYVEAIAEYDKAIKKTPEFALAYAHRAAAQTATNRFPEAITDFEKAVSLDASVSGLVGPSVAPAYAGVASDAAARADHTAAIAGYETALRLNPASPSWTVALATVYRTTGDIALAQNDLDKGIGQYEAALKLDPAPPADATQKLASAYNARGLVRGSIPDYDRAISLAPDFAEAYRNRGLARLAARQPAGLDDLERALQLAPHYLPELGPTISAQLKSRGVMTLNSGNRVAMLDQTLASLTRALEIDEALGQVVTGRAVVTRTEARFSIPVGVVQATWYWNLEDSFTGLLEYSWQSLFRLGSRVLYVGTLRFKPTTGGSLMQGSLTALVTAAQKTISEAQPDGTFRGLLLPPPSTVTAAVQGDRIVVTLRDPTLIAELRALRPEVVILHASGDALRRLQAFTAEASRVQYVD